MSYMYIHVIQERSATCSSYVLLKIPGKRYKGDDDFVCWLKHPEAVKQVCWEVQEREKKKKSMSGVGFEPTPTRVDCDLNAAP